MLTWLFTQCVANDTTRHFELLHLYSVIHGSIIELMRFPDLSDISTMRTLFIAIFLLPFHAGGETLEALQKEAQAKHLAVTQEIEHLVDQLGAKEREAIASENFSKQKAITSPSASVQFMIKPTYHKEWRIEFGQRKVKDFIVLIDYGNEVHNNKMLAFFREWLAKGYTLVRSEVFPFDSTNVKGEEKWIRLSKVR